MQKIDFDTLLKKIRSGTITPDEKEEFEGLMDNTGRSNSINEIEMAYAINDTRNRINKVVPMRKSLFRRFYDYRVAASVLICSIIGLYMLLFTGRTNIPYDNDVAPGKNTAILTLANGRRISLTDAKTGAIATIAGMEVSKTKDGELVFKMNSNSGKPDDKNAFNTIETPNGGQYLVSLPDGSQVWLNAASTLTFPTTFDVTRKVELSGEAYFEVTKDKKHPFVVQSRTQQVQVLGTHFNVSSYANEPSVNTTLLEGSVRVIPASGSDASAVTISPNQQAMNSGYSIGVKEVDANNAVAWKRGRFTFNNEPLESIMRRLARWYDVKVIYQNEAIKEKTFGGSTSRYSNISDVLCMLELTGEVKFKIKGKEITVMN